MDELIRILRELDEDTDWEAEEQLIDDRILDSLSVITLIADLEDAFDIEISAEEIIPENFNSAARMWAMISRLKES